jgi:hypothetical protein
MLSLKTLFEVSVVPSRFAPLDVPEVRVSPRLAFRTLGGQS